MDGFFIPIIIIIAIVATLITRNNKEKQKEAWQRLAQAHHLHFVPDTSFFGNGGYVTGNYQGCPLTLETIQKSHGKSSVTYTRLTLAEPSQQHQPSDQATLALSAQEALNRFTLSYFKYTLTNEIKVEPEGKAIFYEQREIIQDTKFLEYLFDLMTGLVKAYPLVVNLGGEAVPVLSSMIPNKTLRPVVTQLLRDIAQRTSYRLARRSPELLCPDCLTRFGPHTIDLAWEIDPIYYGCRRCGQSRRYFEGNVVAVLDSQRNADPIHETGTVWVNWLARRQLFDFDAVEIVKASDEEVERFAVQVGNDTDEFRQPRYPHMGYVVSPLCHLSENTLRILQRMFGQMVIPKWGQNNFSPNSTRSSSERIEG